MIKTDELSAKMTAVAFEVKAGDRVNRVAFGGLTGVARQQFLAIIDGRGLTLCDPGSSRYYPVAINPEKRS